MAVKMAAPHFYLLPPNLLLPPANLQLPALTLTPRRPERPTSTIWEDLWSIIVWFANLFLPTLKGTHACKPTMPAVGAPRCLKPMLCTVLTRPRASTQSRQSLLSSGPSWALPRERLT